MNRMSQRLGDFDFGNATELEAQTKNGKLANPDHIYEGQLNAENNKKHGRGRLIYSDGSAIVHNWDNDQN
jgi:hypothetical protein